MSAGTKAPGGAPDVSSLRLLSTLSGAGAVAGLLIVAAYTWTTPAIEANRTATIEAAIHEVLPRIERYETLYLHGDALTPVPPPGEDAHKAEKVYAGLDASGTFIGFAVAAREPGFQEPIEVLFGFDPRTRSTLGVSILSSRETPGLGDKIQDKGWRTQFTGRAAPVLGIKKGGQESPATVEMITGATISSRAVIAAINKSIDHWTPFFGTYSQGGRP